MAWTDGPTPDNERKGKTEQTPIYEEVVKDVKKQDDKKDKEK